ncbi:LOW QUALITY PROTEIN: uncharacterized protein LOC112554856 [Pomacea canaliculata]|uniref:LOW QUALITY PROTEIN: uncharacterized protein LOC112554856 n=1 Tax=Pomacea canaliculata TaxID=400727 RepID=UPI000D732A05|nr:LOW QUALITY PROTEIN: uncharacterized protein LOC112554856 [Pomacea canaliculata]
MASAYRGWLTVAGGVLIHLTLGTLYTFGNLSPYLTSYIRKHSSPDLQYTDSVWIFAVTGMGQGTSMYFGGVLERRFGPRITVIIGAWFMSLGVLLTYFTVQYSFEAAVVTYGLMFGLGIGVAYAVPIACGMRWLPKKKGLVSGCVVAGFGAGAFIFDQVQTAFINPDNKAPNETIAGEKYFSQEDVLERVPTIFLLLGGCYAAMQLLGVLLLSNPPPDYLESSYILLQPNNQNQPATVGVQDTSSPGDSKHSNDHTEDTASVGSNSDNDSGISSRTIQDEETESMPPQRMLKTRAFYTLWFIMLLNGQGVVFISSLYKAYGQTFIRNDSYMAWVGAFAAVCNGGGRIIWGAVADRFSFKVAMLCMSCTFTSLMLTFGLTKLGAEAMFFIWVCLLFFGFSGTYSLLPTATARAFGPKYYSMNYGIVFTSQIISNATGALLTSQLKDQIGWFGLFYMVAGFSFMSFLLTTTFNVKNPDGLDI